MGEGKKGPRVSASFELHNCVDGVGVSFQSQGERGSQVLGKGR